MTGQEKQKEKKKRKERKIPKQGKTKIFFDFVKIFKRQDKEDKIK